MPVRRLLGPPLRAHVVRDFDDSVAAVHDVCQYWGGGVDLLVPLREGARAFPARWRALLDETHLDGLITREHLASDRGEKLLGRKVGSSHGEFLAAAIALSRPRKEEWTPVLAALPKRDDPWFLAYVTALGAWPHKPTPRLLEWARLRPDLEWNDILSVEFAEVLAPSPEDLLGRLTNPAAAWPALATTALLGLHSGPRNSGVGEIVSRIPRRRPLAEMVGPNIVVVYDTESVDDLCLLWALRAAHGLHAGLPLGVPQSADLNAALKHFEDEHAGVHFGIGGDRRWALTSISVPITKLREIAAPHGERWRAVKSDELLQPPSRAARSSTTFVTFVGGEARVDAWSEDDRSALGQRPSGAPHLEAVAHLTLENRILPPSETLAGPLPYDGYYHDGGWQLRVRTPPETRAMRWPSGWTVVEALARDRGLTATPSPAGVAAATLLRQIGSLDAVAPLLLPALVADLQRLGERRGMSWFRTRAAEIAASIRTAEHDKIDLLRDELSALSLRPFEEEANDLTFESARRLFGSRDRANAWLGWALDAEILVQGIEIGCSRCGAASWRSVRELAPPIVCRGCGTGIRRPYPTGELKFRYRASEPLLRVIDSDAMSHVLALRWWGEYFASHFNRPSLLVGGYPGIDFKTSTGKIIGEADVLLVFTDGTMIPGECKRGTAGINEAELGKLERLADALRSPWTFTATIAPARDCAPIWKSTAEALDQKRPCLVLTGDHLFDLHPVPLLGVDAFAWRGDTGSQQAERDEEWKTRLSERLRYLSEERDPDQHLFES